MDTNAGSENPLSRLLPLIRRLALVAGVVFLVILAAQVDPAEVLAAFARVSLPGVLAGFAVLVVPYVLRAWRFRVLLSDPLPFLDLFYITLVDSFARDLLPLGLGEVFYPGFLKTQRGVPLAESVSGLVVIHVLDLLILGAFFVIALSQIAPRVPELAQMAGAINLLLLASTAATLALWAFRRPTLNVWRRWSARWRPTAGSRAGTLLDALDHSLEVLQTVTSARALAMAGVLSALLWVITLVGTGVVYQAMGLILGPWELMLLISVMYFFAILPIHSVSGLGTLDSMWVVLIMAFGITQGPALSYTILRRLLSLAFSVLMGGIGLLKLGLRPWVRQVPADLMGDDET